ncbi:CRTAC1 family protein [Flammeovirga sp. MY04]|uniref:FG-GAP repeat domain-containing protein n=1 Tax=Flammeovirga sp. MY04 TaxID=1191459 RepID=UPI000B107BD7|nr:VCBS repeat-containing protein [Flammeovirga sp. MY04]ANQ49741.2 CRTAC1 family protein [Flammeovirga sp. MY04]
MFFGCITSTNQILNQSIRVGLTTEEVKVEVLSSPVKTLMLDVHCLGNYTNLTIKSDTIVLVDNLDIPHQGNHLFNVLVDFKTTGAKTLKFYNQGSEILMNQIALRESDAQIPSFDDVSESSGFKTETTWKYGGPSIGDVNNNGYYDFVLNNHDKVPAKLFWNNGDGTVTQHTEELRRWDIHGSALGDYDNDGDLDILISQGGGNGTNPQPPHLLRNDGDHFTVVTKEAGITLGSRGRSVRWIDLDKDGDLDLIFINAEGLNTSDGLRHILYKNNGDGTFTHIRSEGIESADAERILVTDLNNDNIEDLVLFEPLSIWIGKGDFTFTDQSEKWLPQHVQGLDFVTGATDIDLDNDGLLDLYLARGKTYYQTANKSYDFNPLTNRLDIRDEGNKAITALEFEAEGDITISGIFLWYRLYDDGFPIHLGKQLHTIPSLDENDKLTIDQKMAEGWPDDRSANGWYFGYVGNGKWKMEWVRNKNIYWDVRISVDGVSNVTSTWDPQNRNVQDILLENQGGKFMDVTQKYNLPKGGSHQGVTVGDFNNNGYQDLFVYRFGFLKSRVTDWLLLNNGKGSFDVTTSHKAVDINDKGHGDMGQAFDYNLDGKVDLLSGSDNYGKWYLYKNTTANSNNYLQVRVGYSPKDNVDPMSAVVEIYTATTKYKRRVASAGEIHSQSLLNTVHFGLRNEIPTKVIVRWRNGEVEELNHKSANEVIVVGSRGTTKIN